MSSKKKEILEIKSTKSNPEKISEAYRSIPKLPKGSYKKELKDFLKLIKNYSPEIKKKLLAKYRTVYSANKMRQKILQDGKNYTSVLTELQKMEIIELAGRYFTPSQIMDIIRNEWKIKYSNASLNALLKRNKDVIFEKRRRYVSSIDGLRLVHERPRIEELSEIYEEARANNNNKLAIEALREIRQEVKGDTLRIDGNMNMNVNVNVKEHLLKEIDIHSFIKLALLKVLEKHNIDFMKIAHRFKFKKVPVFPDSEKSITKLMPDDVEGVGLLPEAKVKKNLEVEEANVIIPPEELKNKLIEKIKSKTNEIVKIKSDVEMKQEVEKPEEFEKLKEKTKKKIEKKIIKNKIKDDKQLKEKLQSIIKKVKKRSKKDETN